MESIHVQSKATLYHQLCFLLRSWSRALNAAATLWREELREVRERGERLKLFLRPYLGLVYAASTSGKL